MIWRSAYMVARRIGLFVRLLVAMGAPGYDTAIVELHLVGRRSGRPRAVLVTLIRLHGRWYVGHPNGPRAWLANLASADEVAIALPRSRPIRVRAVALGLGTERDAVIRETALQQPWPGSMLYRAAQRHILRSGVYYRLEPVQSGGVTMTRAPDRRDLRAAWPTIGMRAAPGYRPPKSRPRDGGADHGGPARCVASPSSCSSRC